MPTDMSLHALLDRSRLVGEEDLSLVAGNMKATEADLKPLTDWLAGLEAPTWWFYREYTDRMRLGKEVPAPPADLERLVAARWFSERGDLEIWRQDGSFGWRFVGDPGASPPADVPAEDFFAGAAARLRRGIERTALLWRQDEARIATADDATRAYLDGEPRLLRYRPFYDNGVVAVVWYLRIEPDHSAAITSQSSASHDKKGES